MASEPEGSFRFISVNADDEDELVIHAGGAGRDGGGGASASPAGAAPDSEPARFAGGAQAPDAAAPGVPADTPAPSADDSARAAASAKTEQLKRRAQAIEEAEAGLQDPKTFRGMNIAVVAALVVLLAVVVVYMVVMRG